MFFKKKRIKMVWEKNMTEMCNVVQTKEQCDSLRCKGEIQWFVFRVRVKSVNMHTVLYDKAVQQIKTPHTPIRRGNWNGTKRKNGQKSSVYALSRSHYICMYIKSVFFFLHSVYRCYLEFLRRYYRLIEIRRARFIIISIEFRIKWTNFNVI